MISRTKPARSYWDNPVQRLGANDDLRSIEVQYAQVVLDEPAAKSDRT